MTVSEARAALPSLLSKVEEGEEVTITRHGKPVAVLVRPRATRVARLEALERARKIGELIDQARREPLPDLTKGGLKPGQADAWVAELRRERDRDV